MRLAPTTRFASCAGWTLCLALAACAQTLEVLGPSEFDASVPSPDATGPDPVPFDAGDCTCEGLALCAAGRCVNTAGITRLAAGIATSCRIQDGRLSCWGANGSGQLGLGDSEHRDLPARVGSDNDWLEITLGERHACGIRAPGHLYCWGANDKGQLGLGDTVARAMPQRVAGRDDWRSVDCDGDGCCGLRAAGQLFCWGDNLEGRTAQADPFGAADVLEPTEPAAGGRYQALALGQGHACAVAIDGSLWCWGRAIHGEAAYDPAVGHLRTVTRVHEESDWVRLAASQHHTCAVRGDGSLWCWGRAISGELGQPGWTPGNESDVHSSPLRVGSDADWSEVATGWFHTCGLKRDGRLFCWGRAIEGQLGQGGSIEPIPEPTPIALELRFERLALGNFHTCATVVAGELHCWGANDRGQLGLGDRERRHEPAPLSD